MTQTSNRFFDEIGRLMNDAAGAAQGVKREVDTVVRNQAEKILNDLEIVKREEFEAVKDMARLAREENEALKARIAVLEAKLGVSAGGAGCRRREAGRQCDLKQRRVIPGRNCSSIESPRCAKDTGTANSRCAIAHLRSGPSDASRNDGGETE